MNPVLALQPGALVACDFFGPLSARRGGVSCVFVVLDCFFKYIRLYGMKRAVTQVAVDKILNDFNNVVPVKCVIADHGTQFISRY